MDPGEIHRCDSAQGSRGAFDDPGGVSGETADHRSGLADVLVGSLHLDFAFVRLRDPTAVQPSTSRAVTRGKAFPEWLQGHLAASAALAQGNHSGRRRRWGAVPRLVVRRCQCRRRSGCRRCDRPTFPPRPTSC